MKKVRKKQRNKETNRFFILFLLLYLSYKVSSLYRVLLGTLAMRKSTRLLPRSLIIYVSLTDCKVLSNVIFPRIIIDTYGNCLLTRQEKFLCILLSSYCLLCVIFPITNHLFISSNIVQVVKYFLQNSGLKVSIFGKIYSKVFALIRQLYTFFQIVFIYYTTAFFKKRMYSIYYFITYNTVLECNKTINHNDITLV